MLVVNTYYTIALQTEKKDDISVTFNPMNLSVDELDSFNTKLNWLILASMLLTLVFIVAQFKIYQKLKYRTNLIAE